MQIVGGSYRERCFFPFWDRIFGSGMRSALAVSQLSSGSTLHTYAYREWSEDVEQTAGTYGITANVIKIDTELTFQYWHPLRHESPPDVGDQQFPRIDIHTPDETALIIGMLETAPRVKAKRAIFVPQSKGDSFIHSGSSAQELAYILKRSELTELFEEGTSERDAVRRIMNDQQASVVVARGTIGGADIYVGDAPPLEVPPYEAKSWFKIGAGDVFCAAFAHYWGEKGMDPSEAADLASKSVAYFNEGHRIPLPAPELLQDLVPIKNLNRSSRVFLAGTGVTMPQYQMLDDARFHLEQFKLETESPFHEGYNPSVPQPAVIEEGLKKLADCSAVLAIADGRPLEANITVGLARAQGLPVIIFAESLSESDRKLLANSNCELISDLPTAIYRTWLATRR